MIQGLDHAALNVINLPLAVAFYREVPGFRSVDICDPAATSHSWLTLRCRALVSYPVSYNARMDASKGWFQVSVEDYLEGEKDAAVKHEYVHGEVFALAGSSDTHNTIALNIALALTPAARRKGCRVYMSDMKVRVGESFYYPAVMFVCEDGPDAYYKDKPCVIVEVLSPRGAPHRHERKALRLSGLAEPTALSARRQPPPFRVGLLLLPDGLVGAGVRRRGACPRSLRRGGVDGLRHLRSDAVSIALSRARREEHAPLHTPCSLRQRPVGHP